MTPELQRVRSHFDADAEGRAECPICHHHSLTLDAGNKVAVLAHCFSCGDASKAELAKLISSIARDTTITIRPQSTATHKKIEWSEDQLVERLTTAQQNLTGDTAAQAFLAGRGISLELAQQFGLGAGHFYYEDRLVIPYTDGVLSESLLQLRYRRIRNPANKKGKWAAGKRLLGGRRLFNLPLLRCWDPENTSPLFITEAELDCMMLAGLGVHAVSVDTAGHRLVEDDLALLRQVRHLILAFDQDEAGEKCTARFKQHLPSARVLGGYAAPGVKDIGDLRQSMGHEAFAARLRRFLERKGL